MHRLAREPTRSLIIFVVSLAVFVSLLLLIMNREGRLLVLIEMGLARSADFILRLLGNNTHVIDQIISSDTFRLEVIPSCTGMYLLSVYLSGVIAYPSRWSTKLIGFILGLIGIFVTNTIRLVSLFFVGIHFPAFLDTFHLLIWQSLMIVFILFLWLFWIVKVVRSASEA